MSWLLRHNWLWSMLAFFLGAAITWVLLDRRKPAAAPPLEEPALEPEPVLVGATASQAAPTPHPTPAAPATPAARATPAAPASPAAPAAPVRETVEPVFSRVMDSEPTLFDAEMTAPERQATVVQPGRYGEGSAEAVPHQGPPDGFTIKGNAQSKLFHTPDSPYYGRTKPEVWFRSEADAERAGFTKYTRRPRKSADPRD
ncbi:hypothetical protein ACFWUU_35840 [Kribbella sp. NPDC058693]|uniref:sunset domain-containing protein n=1 Tax=Kribbella sp. NPDC058693 TaxID=3346602 RepID=UPI00365FE979